VENTTTCLGLVDHLLLFHGHSTNVGGPRDSVEFIAARHGKVDLAVAGKWLVPLGFGDSPHRDGSAIANHFRGSLSICVMSDFS
jgi:hypothetical protein